MQSVLIFIGNMGFNELLIILVIVLVLFGSTKIPGLMRGIGQGIREFNKAKGSVEDDVREGIRDAERKSNN